MGNPDGGPGRGRGGLPLVIRTPRDRAVAEAFDRVQVAIYEGDQVGLQVWMDKLRQVTQEAR